MSEKNRYNDFDTFLKDVVETAKHRSDILKEKYDIKNLSIIQIIIIILVYGNGSDSFMQR